MRRGIAGAGFSAVTGIRTVPPYRLPGESLADLPPPAAEFGADRNSLT
jgi:hypothetical protein